MNTEGGLEIRGFVEVVLEAFSHGMAVGADEIGLHLRFADHTIPVETKK